ncbi:hypothetical protein Hdeb2414_s0003g00103111 [Helianthus debilis subsp. tardiflorus]
MDIKMLNFSVADILFLVIIWRGSNEFQRHVFSVNLKCFSDSMPLIRYFFYLYSIYQVRLCPSLLVLTVSEFAGMNSVLR